MSAQDDLQKATDALENPNFKGPYKFEGKNYTLTQLRDDLIPKLQDRANREKTQTQTAAKGFANLQAQIERAEKNVTRNQEIVSRNRNAFAKGNLSESELAQSETRLEEAIRVRDQLTTRPAFPKQTGTTPPTTTATTSPTETTTPPATPTTATTTTPTTPTSGTTTKGGGKAGGKGRTKPNVAWEETFKKEFPQYAYLLDETIFGADMTELLRRSITEKWYEEDDSIATQLFTGGLTGTNYYRTTTTNQQNFDKSTPANKQQLIDTQKLNISQTYGELQLNDETITGIATKAARDGKTGKALELLVYQAAFAAKPETAEMPVATPVTRALTSTQADQVRAAARKYGQFASNNDIQSVLTGATTLDNLTQNYKLTAKRIFRGLAQDIDSGLTVEQVFDPYRRYAASVLEKPLESIDLFDAAGKPTNFQDAIFGNEGPLSLGDWVTKLKSDDKYGYQFTNQARQQATNLVMEMEKAFGFRR